VSYFVVLYNLAITLYECDEFKVKDPWREVIWTFNNQKILNAKNNSSLKIGDGGFGQIRQDFLDAKSFNKNNKLFSNLVFIQN